MTKKISKIALYISLAVLVLLAGGAMFSQTGMFRASLRSTLYEVLKNNVNANVYIGEIQGNLFTGFSIDTLFMYVDNAPFVSAGKLTARYDPLKIFSNNLTILSLSIENPIVHLFRFKNGEWNVDHLSTSPSKKGTTPSTFRAELKHIAIHNATFSLVDSTGRFDSVVVDRTGKPSINYSNIFLEKITVNLSGYYTEQEQQFSINTLSFQSPQQQFILKKLAANIFHDTARISINNLLFETPETKLEASLEMRAVDVFKISSVEKLQHVPVRVSIRPSNVSSRDIHVFLPVLYFIQGNIALSTEMNGEFGNMNFSEVRAEFGQSTLLLSGSLANVHDPEKLFLNFTSQHSTIKPIDISTVMPFFNIPQFPAVELSTLDLHFVGEPLNFAVQGKLTAPAGVIGFDGEMDISQPALQYKATFTGQNVNLENIFGLHSLASHLNTVITLEGRGTTIDDLDAQTVVQMDSSSFNGLPIRNALIHLSAKDKILSGDISLLSSEGRIEMRNKFSFAKNGEPSLSLNAEIRNLNLAKFLRDKKYASDLSFDLNWKGTSFDILNGNSETHLQFQSSLFGVHQFDSVEAHVIIKKDSLEKYISLTSPVADIALRGNYELPQLMNNVLAHSKQFDRFVSYQQKIIDTSFAFISDSLSTPQSMDKPFSAYYTLSLKNLLPVSIFFALPEFDAKGTVEGRIAQTDQKNILSGISAIERAIYLKGKSGIGIQSIKASYNFSSNLSDSIGISSFTADLGIEGEELLVNNTSFKRPMVTISFANQKGTFSVFSDIDTTLGVRVEGNISVNDTSDTFHFSKAQFRYQGFDIVSQIPFSIELSAHKFSIDSALFTHRDEQFAVSGVYHFNGEVNALASIKNFESADLFFFNRSQKFREEALMFGGTLHANIQMRGAIANPNITIVLDGKNLAHRGINFGTLRSTMVYSNKIAKFTSTLGRNGDSTVQHDVELTGEVPIDLALEEIENRTNIQGMNLAVQLKNLPLHYFDVFIPELDRMEGKITSAILLTGSLENPLFAGTAQLDSGKFLFEMTGVTYNASGSMTLDGNRITMNGLRVQNLNTDYSASDVAVGGYIVMKGFIPSEYHINAKGELLAMKEGSRLSNASFSGSLIAATDANGISFEGTFERSRIGGTVLVKQAKLVFPPKQKSSAYNLGISDDVQYFDDTSIVSVDSSTIISLVKAIQQSVQTSTPNENGISTVTAKERTFMDGFGYDLSIQTQGNVRVNMIFNANATAYEELYAELNGKLTLTQDEKGVQLRGTINIGNESNYTFYKKFSAAGSLTFIGPPDNPQLNIIAKYQGTHQIKPEETQEEKVVVSLNITGDRVLPKIKIGLATIDLEGKEIQRTGDIENDAVSFLLTSSSGVSGRFRDELTAQDKDKITAQITSTIGGALFNGMVSGFVMDYIQNNKVPFVKKFEILDVTTTKPDVRIGAEVWEVYVNVGGKVFNDINNANISFEIPLGNPQRRNFMLEVERKTESETIQSRTSLGARIYYRFTF